MGSHKRRKAAGLGAAATPRAVLDALVPEVLHVADIALRPVDMGHVLALERIKSPVLESIAQATIEDAARALYLLTMPGDQAMRLVRDPKQFEDGLAAFVTRVPAGEVRTAADKLASSLKAAFETLVPGKESAGDGSPFQGSPAPAPSSAGS